MKPLLYAAKLLARDKLPGVRVHFGSGEGACDDPTSPRQQTILRKRLQPCEALFEDATRSEVERATSK
ncbi:MAG TPA: hypothetical protein V6D17_04005 [Candidatus Obscuribacterales bacterium]